MAKISKNKAFDKIYIGVEPFIAKIDSENESNYIKMLNWYNYAMDQKDARKFVIEWMKSVKIDKKQIENLKSTPDWSHGVTIGWICRMILNGTEFVPSKVSYIQSKIEEAIKKYANFNTDEIEDETSFIPIINNKTNRFITMIEELVVDKFMITKDELNVDLYGFLNSNNVPRTACNTIRDYYKPQFDEIISDDPDVKEAFGKHLKAWKAFWTNFFNDLDRYVGNKKIAIKKPRAKKIKPLGKLVERLKYRKEDHELKLMSINPQDIINATQLWVFNTKYRTLSVFNSIKGLNVKGTTIINFDESTSKTKKLRKPEVTISELFSAGKVSLRKFMDEIKTIESIANGRINEHVVLLKVVK